MITTRTATSARDPPRFFGSTSGCASGAEDPDDSILPLLTYPGHVSAHISVFWRTIETWFARIVEPSKEERTFVSGQSGRQVRAGIEGIEDRKGPYRSRA